jgi:hypothetical protein
MSCLLLDEPKRLAGVETDSPKVNPQGDQTERRAGHQPRRGIGAKAASRQAARRVSLPSGGRFSNITEDVRKYAAEPSGARQLIHKMTRRASRAASQQAISEKEALRRGIEEKSKEFVEAGEEFYAKVESKNLTAIYKVK